MMLQSNDHLEAGQKLEVLASSQPANNSGQMEPSLDSLLLVFDEDVQALRSDFSVWGTSLTRPGEVPELEMASGAVSQLASGIVSWK